MTSSWFPNCENALPLCPSAWNAVSAGLAHAPTPSDSAMALTKVQTLSSPFIWLLLLSALENRRPHRRDYCQVWAVSETLILFFIYVCVSLCVSLRVPMDVHGDQKRASNTLELKL